MNKEAANNANLTVRPAEPSDVPLIHSLIRGLAEYEKLASTPSSSPKRAARASVWKETRGRSFDRRPRRRTGRVCIVFFDVLDIVGKPGIWLEDLFVIPKFRKRGFGSRLLTEVAKIAIARNCGRLEWSVLDWNEPAINLYRQRGAAILDDWRICRVDGDRLTKLATTGAQHA